MSVEIIIQHYRRKPIYIKNGSVIIQIIHFHNSHIHKLTDLLDQLKKR